MQEKSAIWANHRPLLIGLYAKNRRGGHNVPPPLVIGLRDVIVKTDGSFAAPDTTDLRRDAVTLIKWRHIML